MNGWEGTIQKEFQISYREMINAVVDPKVVQHAAKKLANYSNL